MKDEKTNITFDLHIRSPVEVRRDQISNACSSNTFFDPLTSSTKSPQQYSHPMFAQLGDTGVSSVKQAIMNHPDDDVSRKVPSVSGEASFVGLMQLYSDKLKTSLKESAFQCHPLHVSLLNFSEDIVPGRTPFAFLPVNFTTNDNEEGISGSLSRETRLRLLHDSMKLSMEELASVAYRGFQCTDFEKKSRLCHPCWAAYCYDLPEVKDMTSVRNGNSSIRNCHRCKAQTNTFNKFTMEAPRNAWETKSVISKAFKEKEEGKIRESKSLLKQLSLVDQVPRIMEFPFVSTDSTLDMDSLFTLGALHTFHLGTSKELKICLSEHLQTDEIYTRAIPTKSGMVRRLTFKNARHKSFNGINQMLHHIQRTSPVKGLQIDFTKHGSGRKGNGLYGADGTLMGMLEAKQYRSVDLVSPFIGTLVDRCSDEALQCPNTSVFVQYVDIIAIILCSGGDTGWSEEKVKNVERRIERFKNDASDLYAEHQSSGLCTEKFHLLDHIPDDIRRLGSIASGDAGLFEYTHTMFKKAYRSGTKRKTTAMDHTVNNFLLEHFGSKIATGVYQEKNENETGHNTGGPKVNLQPNSAIMDSINGDCGALAKAGKYIDVHELDVTRAVFRKLRNARETEHIDMTTVMERRWNSCSSIARDIVKDMGEDGTRVFLREVETMVKSDGKETHEFQLSRVISGYVSGRGTPSAGNYCNSLSAIEINENGTRISQRIVSGRGFYNNENLRQDCVLIQGQDHEPVSSTLWVAKVLGIFRLHHKQPNSNASSIDGNELVFVQYYDVQPPMNNMDRILGCIRLRWARDTDDVDYEEERILENGCSSQERWKVVRTYLSRRFAWHRSCYQRRLRT